MSDDYGGIVIPRRTMTLFFIIDTSGSMFGEKIGAVNQAIREVIPEIKELSDGNADAEIKIAVLDFSNGARWITPNGPMEANQLQQIWKNLDSAGGTDLGAACVALKEKLSVSQGFMAEATGSYAPVLFLLSDGQPVDDWQKGLDELKKNNWYKASIRVALAIGNDADKDVLEAFTGNSEMVLEVHNSAALIKMIKFVSVRASQVASGSDNAQTKQDAAVQAVMEIKEEIAATPDSSGPDW